jgi:hypothetical protein
MMGGNPGAGVGPMGGGINGSGGAAQMGQQMPQMGGAQMGPGGVFSEEMSIPAPMVRALIWRISCTPPPRSPGCCMRCCDA